MAQSTIVQTGSVTKADELSRKLVEFNVPTGTTSIHVKYEYTGQDHGNAIDLGLLGVDGQFRGYSGGSRNEIMVANNEATPGYIPGLLAAGKWAVTLGIYQIKTSMATYRVDIHLDTKLRPEFRSNPAPSRATYTTMLRRKPGYRPCHEWLKGDFHVHSVYSDGKLSLDNLVKRALDRGLDFIFSTEHNTNSANIEWGSHVREGFLVGRGIEVTTYGGHWNAIGLMPHQMIDSMVDDMENMDQSLVKAVENVHKSDGFAIINHPFAECRCCAWDFSFHDAMDAIEIWNGPWKRHPDDISNEKALETWDAMLREDKIFPATGGSDLHEPHFEIGEPVTRVLADENSVGSIIRALRDRHIYIAQHPDYEIEFRLEHGGNSANIGGWLEADDSVTARVSLNGFPHSELRLLTEQGIVHRTTETAGEWIVRAHYVRVEVRDMSNNMLGLTNPIWILKPGS